MRTTKLFILIGAISINVVFAQKNSPTSEEGPYLTLPKIQVVPITETSTGRQYELYIKLPEGYPDSTSLQYPVIYYTDALWHVEILSASAEYILEDVILVGISWQKDINEELKEEVGNHVSRFRDYTVEELSNPEHQAKYQFGQVGNHLDFIRNDVITYVESNYRAAPNNRTYFGYSLGGTFGAYTLLARPNTFKNYILGSPSLKGDIPYLTALGAKAASKRQGLNTNVFISYGTLEEELGGYAEQLITLLKARNDDSLSLTNVVIEGSHQTAFPMTGVQSVTWLSNLTRE